MADAALTDELPTAESTGSMILASHRMPLPAAFAFDCYGTHFNVGIRRSADGGAEMVLRGDLGIVPYNAGSKSVRNHLHAAIEAGGNLPNAEISVDSHQTIVVRGSMSFPAVPSPAIVAAGAAAMTIAVKPVCDLIAKYRQLKDG